MICEARGWEDTFKVASMCWRRWKSGLNAVSVSSTWASGEPDSYRRSGEQSPIFQGLHETPVA